MVNKYIKILRILSHYGNANQNHNEATYYYSKNHFYQKVTKITNTVKNAEKQEHLYSVGRTWTVYTHYVGPWNSPLKKYMLYDPVILLLDRFTEGDETITLKMHLCSHVYYRLVKAVKILNQPLMDIQIKNICYMCIMEYYSTTIKSEIVKGMGLEMIILSEICHYSLHHVWKFTVVTSVVWLLTCCCGMVRFSGHPWC